MAELSSERLPSGAEVKHFAICGERVVWIVGLQRPPHTGTVSLPLSDVDPLIRALAPEVIDALHKALPVVAALCGALAETCDEEAADALATLVDLTGRFTQEVPA